MVVPIDPDINEAENVAQEDGSQRPEAEKSGRSGRFNSRTMMVMIIASTPSLNASSLFFAITQTL